MSEKSIDSDDSEINFIPEVEIENARQRAAVESNNYSSSEDNLFGDEPLADEEWTTRYEREVKANEELERKLKDRLDGSVNVSEW